MEGLYIGAQGMISSQNYINTNANNISNVSSTGFKFDTMISKIYEKLNDNRETDGNKTSIGGYQNGVMEEGIITNLKPGEIKVTNDSLNASILDNQNSTDVSFFVVQSGGQEYLTRNGDFETNEQGQLKTNTGDFVMSDNNQPIVVPKGVKPMITKEGNVVDADTGNVIAKIQMKSVSQQNRPLLAKEEAAKFSYNGNINVLPSSQAQLETGSIELSNVDLTKEMTDLLSNQQRFQANQKVFLSNDTVLNKEANQLMK